MALYDAASGLIVSRLLIYPSNEPPEARSGKRSSWLLYTAALEAQCVRFHASLYLCSHWMTVMDNLREKPCCSSSNPAFPGLLMNSLLTHWESAECRSWWLHWPLVRRSKVWVRVRCRSWGQVQGDPFPRARVTAQTCVSYLLLALNHRCRKHSHTVQASI